MQRIFQILFFVFVGINLYSQILPEKINYNERFFYHLDSYKDEVINNNLIGSCDIYGTHINFTESLGGMYDITFIVYATRDIINIIPLSIGTYNKKGDKLILFDNIHGYKMVLQKKSNKLEFVSGPNWFIKKVFDKDTDEEESGGWWNINDIDLLELRKQNLKEYASNSNLICGIYGSGHFFLDLQTNKNYTYYFNRIPLLKGTWEKNGSE